MCCVVYLQEPYSAYAHNEMYYILCKHQSIFHQPKTAFRVLNIYLLTSDTFLGVAVFPVKRAQIFYRTSSKAAGITTRIIYVTKCLHRMSYNGLV